MARRTAIIGGVAAGLVLLALLAACQSDDPRGYGDPPKTAEEKALNVECKAKGGTFKRTGLAAFGYCEPPPAADAGKLCTDGEQCQSGLCVTESGRPGQCTDLPSPGVGMCGVTEMVKGKPVPMVCAD